MCGAAFDNGIARRRRAGGAHQHAPRHKTHAATARYAHVTDEDGVDAPADAVDEAGEQDRREKSRNRRTGTRPSGK